MPIHWGQRCTAQILTLILQVYKYLAVAALCADGETPSLMLRCPFFEDHPELFLLWLCLLLVSYLIYYGFYCLILYLLDVIQRVVGESSDSCHQS